MHEDDLRIIAGFLDARDEAVAEVRSWVAIALRSFGRRLASDLEDVSQDVVLEITRFLQEGRFRGESRLRTYVWRVATSRAIERLRARSRRQWIDLDSIEVRSQTPSPLAAAMTREMEDVALRVVAELPRRCRDLWQMLLGGQRYREIAQRTGIAEGTLRVRVLRCRNQALAIRARLTGVGQEKGNDSPPTPPNEKRL